MIGGFLGQSWNSSEDWIYDKEAFLFSITNKIKTAIMAGNETYGGYGSSMMGPVFGSGYDMSVDANFTTVTLQPGCYSETQKLTKAVATPSLNPFSNSGTGSSLFGPSSIFKTIKNQWKVNTVEVYKFSS